MATTTPNYGWDVPTSTDYVKDGATAIETLGDDIDASLFSITTGKNVGLSYINTLSWASGTSSASIDSVFTTAFAHYRLVLNCQAGGTSDGSFFRLNFRASGSDLTGNQFGRFKHVYDDATSWGNNVLTTGNYSIFPVYTRSGVAVVSSIDLTSPASTANKKVFTGTGFSDIFISIGGGQWDSTSAADGFKISVASGNLGAGSVRVYGYK
jgi:hypothetical protein